MKRPLALAFGLTLCSTASWVGCGTSSDDSVYLTPGNDAGNDVSSQGGASGQAGAAGAAGTSSGGSPAGGSAGTAAGGSSSGGQAGSNTGGSAGEPPDAATDVDYPDVDFSYDAPGFDAAEACATANVEAALKPLDMYFMIDRSGSMSGTPWIQQGQALSAFFHAPASAGITVAMRFFPITDDFSAKDPGCNGDSYVKPLVNWGVLPGWANALDTAYGNVIPNGGTPTQEAITGVLRGALERQIAFPQHVVVAVMVSDGAPCCDGTCPVETAAGIGQIAANYLAGTPSIRTFAIYVSSQANDVMTAIATQGGTGQAFNATGGTQALLDALKTIQGTAIPCEFEMPTAEAGIINPNQITLDYVSGGNSTPVSRVDNQNLCGANGGWYYDNNNSPSKILLCPATCTTMKADPNAKVNISLGCLGS